MVSSELGKPGPRRPPFLLGASLLVARLAGCQVRLDDTNRFTCTLTADCGGGPWICLTPVDGGAPYCCDPTSPSCDGGTCPPGC